MPLMTMFGLDTNVLVRFLLQDDLKQAEHARRVIEEALAAGEPVAIGLLAILETEWVLRSCAKLHKKTVITTFRMLLEARDLRIEHEESLEHALYLYENNTADFADCLMATRYTRSGCSAMLTFDQKTATIPGVVLLIPSTPQS
jgi:predicted nucleic-acid-binding protein